MRKRYLQANRPTLFSELNIPILFMTARDDFAAKQRGFRMGIDDYMVKPIDLEELLLHVEALLRRAGITTSHKLEVGNLVLNADERSAVLRGEEIPLTVRVCAAFCCGACGCWGRCCV